MRNVLVTSMAALLWLSVSAFCEKEVKSHRSFSFGFSLGQRAGDVAESIILTSPYMHSIFSQNPCSRFAIRLSGDLRIKKDILTGETIESLQLYYATRLGLVGIVDFEKRLRFYDEIGLVSVIPTTEMASSQNPRFGLYGYLGSEFLMGKNLLTRNTSLFMEIGLEGLYSEHRFDKLTNRPLMGWGPTVSAGVRFYL